MLVAVFRTKFRQKSNLSINLLDNNFLLLFEMELDFISGWGRQGKYGTSAQN